MIIYRVSEFLKYQLGMNQSSIQKKCRGKLISNLGLRILEKFKRPFKDLVEKIKGILVANIADCINRIFV